MTEETTSPDEGQDGGQAQAVDADWTSGLADDAKAFVEAKGFKGIGPIIESYCNLEKLRGVPEDRLLKLPEKMDAEGMASVYDRLGRPEAPDKYTRALGEGFDDDVFKGIASKAHELGLNDTQFSGLQEITAGLADELTKKQEAAAVEAFDGWRAKNEQSFNAAARMMANMGVSDESLDGILSGDKTALYDFLGKVASRSAEGDIVKGESPDGGFSMTPAAASAKAQDLLSDEDFMKTYTSNNQRIRQPAIDRLESLYKIAAGSK